MLELFADRCGCSWGLVGGATIDRAAIGGLITKSKHPRRVPRQRQSKWLGCNQGLGFVVECEMPLAVSCISRDADETQMQMHVVECVFRSNSTSSPQNVQSILPKLNGRRNESMAMSVGKCIWLYN